MTIKRPPKRDLSDLTGLRLALYCRVSADKQGTEKSVTDQEAEGRRWAEYQRCRVIEPVFVDNDRSASRFATKEREDFDRLLAAIEAGEMDIIWFWELTRSQRKLDVYAKLRDMCRDRGILWVVSGRVYDLTSPADLMALGFQAINGEYESEMTSERTRRGQAGAASVGKPHGKLAYGYARVYDERGRYVRQELDTKIREAVDASGNTTYYSRSEVIREIITKIAHSEPLIAIERDLNARGIPGPREGQLGWHRSIIRRMAMSPTYIGRRIYQGEALDIEDCWPPIVDDETFYAARNVLSEPSRKTTRPSRARHLLSYLIRCSCGRQMQAARTPGGRGVLRYRCLEQHSSIVAADLDEVAEMVIVGYLSRDDVYADLMVVSDAATAVSAARGECERLRAELEEWRSLAEGGEVTAVSFARAEKGLLAKLAEAERAAVEVSIPPALRGAVGPQAAESWARLDLAIKREIVHILADVRVSPVGRGRKNVPISERVTWRWLIGPDQDIDPIAGT